MYTEFRLRSKLLLPLGAAVLFCLLALFPVVRFARNKIAARPGAGIEITSGPAASAAENQPHAADANSRTVPILMYHSVCDRSAGRSVYVLSPAVFREDLRYLKAHGYRTVFIRDLLAFAAGTGTLPEKPAVLTFDDGFYNNLTNVLPLLREENARAELNVVGAYADNAEKEQYRSPNYSYLTWAEIRTLQASGYFEIGSHTYNMHSLSPRNGCAQKKGESDGSYGDAISADAAAMRDAMLREKVDATLIFAYPFGAKSKNTQTLLERVGFTVFLTCDERLNELAANRPLPPLCRINRSSALSTEDFMKKHGIG